MNRSTCIVLTLILSACATATKSAQPSDMPTVRGPAETQPPSPPKISYSVADLGKDWETRRDVTLQRGTPPTKFLLRHKTEGKYDVAIMVFIVPAIAGTTAELAAQNRAADEKQGISVTGIMCAESDPPMYCEYSGRANSSDGPMVAKITFKVMRGSGETAIISGFAQPNVEETMLAGHRTVVGSLTASVEK